MLKIDRSFISGLGKDSGDGAIVRAIISLAKSLDLAVTGEGIETIQQAEMLGSLGCENGQGYFYGRPIDGTSTTALLRALSAHDHALPNHPNHDHAPQNHAVALA